MKRKTAVITFAILVLVLGCARQEDPVSLRADLVPLKMMVTDYLLKDQGRKLIKIEASANYVVPLSTYEPHEGYNFP